MIYFYNGEYRDEYLAAGVDSLIFTAGAGFSESILYNGHTLAHLEAHIDRLIASLEHYAIPHAKIPFQETAMELLRRENLLTRTAEVVVIYPIFDLISRANPVVYAKPCAWVSDRVYELAVYPHQQLGHLAAHRSANGLHRALAKRFAHAADQDDSVLTDFEGRVLETTDHALVFASGKRFVTPRSRYIRGSLALERAGSVLAVREQEIYLRDIGGYDHAYVVGALIGMKPVSRIGDFEFTPDFEACRLANLRLK
jgi:4-amino-4-deoxychorismate lyase